MKNRLLAMAAWIAGTMAFALPTGALHAEGGPMDLAPAYRHQPAPAAGKFPAKATKPAKHVAGVKTKARRQAGYASPKGGAKYSGIINRYAAAYGVPSSLAHAIIRIESNYRANARGSHGEIGLMQIKPQTARMMGYSGSASGLFNPETNIKWGMKYLAKAHSLGGGSVCGTVLRYNAGHGARRMNPTSARYCSKVKRYI